MNNKALLTFDVELWHETDWLKPHIDTNKIKDSSFEKSIDAILTSLKSHGHSATFFVTSTVTEVYPEVVRRIADAGHEIGSHGVDHLRLTNVDKGGYEQKFKAHIKTLEEVAGKKVLGFRAPHFSLTDTSSWVLDLLVECGLKYDSSIFPMNMGEYGRSDTPRAPFTLTTKHADKILEVPISTTSIGSIKVPYAGGIYFRLLPLPIFSYFLKKELKKTFAPVVYFHPHELEAITPKIKSGPWLKRMLKYWGVGRSYRKFETLLSKFQFGSIEDAYFKDTGFENSTV